MLGPGPSSRRAGGRSGDSGSIGTQTVYQRRWAAGPAAYGLGVTNLIRAGVPPAVVFVTLQTSCSDSTGEIARVTDLPAPVPVSTATCHEGRKNSYTRTVSPPA